MMAVRKSEELASTIGHPRLFKFTPEAFRKKNGQNVQKSPNIEPRLENFKLE
jgi:hypothetical protein